MKLSASPFARACSGVTRWWWNPSVLANSANSLELNGGPLSDSSCLGVPWVANMVFSLSLVGRKAVECVLETSGYLVLLSVASRL